MRILTPETASLGPSGADTPGLSAISTRVSSGGEAALGHLDGPGLAVVIDGRGSVVVGGTPHPLRPGDVLERHPSGGRVVRATDDADLVLVELTWSPARHPAESGAPRVWTPRTSSFEPAFGIEMAAIGSHSEGELPGPGMAYGRIAAGGATTPHHHDETEALLVVSGEGVVVANNCAHPVAPGTLVLVEPFEDHVLCNTDSDEILFVDLYWRDAARAASAARSPGAERLRERPVFIFSTPPTPNGDLHLGHLSGPYLGADVFRRYQRLNGVDAYHLTGSDDFQSYVVGRARQDGTTPQEVAARFAAEIRATLDLMDVPVDEFYLTSRAPRYRDGLRAFFSRLVASSAVAPRRAPALVDTRTGDYQYEGDVRGGCPTCGAATGGNICEECGEPNLCADLVDPRSSLPDVELGTADVERFSLPLHHFRDVVVDHHRRGRVTPRLQDLARRVFERADFHLPVSHPSTWGVPPAEPVAGDQVIWVWPEMAYGFLYGIAELGRRLGRDWSADRPRTDWKIVHFFGYDNSFYHAILYPILYKLAYPDWVPDIEYNVNEFYLLDGLKFSTSRRHAIWGKEILSAGSVDAVRYYLALTRGEGERTNFQLEAFRRSADERLAGVWQGWLGDLGQRIADAFDGRAPDAGSWTPVQKAFLGALQMRLERISLHLGADGFALNDAMREIDGLVDDAVRFSRRHAELASNARLRDEWRTAIALELAAARLLAHVTAPVMPRFSGRLASSLGQPVVDRWPDVVTLVPPGSEMALGGTVFFEPAAVPAEAAGR